MDQTSRPLLLLRFTEFRKITLYLEIDTYNSNSKYSSCRSLNAEKLDRLSIFEDQIISSSKLTVDRNTRLDDAFIFLNLTENDELPLESGIWKTTVRLDEEYHDEMVLHEQEYLILPLENSISDRNEQLYLAKLKQFWTFKSMCFNAVVGIDETVSNQRKECKRSYWSTNYPDPKSEFP